MYLKSYECHYCDALCKPHVLDELFNPGMCVNCGRFACGECQFIFKIEHPEKKPSCVEGKEECDYITRFFGVLDYLLEFAPDEELKLLDLGKWSPLWCDRCEGAITQARPLGFINKFSCICLGCTGRNPVNFRKNAAISTLTKLIDEVRTYFADVSVADAKVKSSAITKCARTLFILQSMKCEYCNVLDSFRYISKTGSFVCGTCVETKNIKHFDLALNKIALNLYEFRICISNPNDLKLLSYSKWSPLKCEECCKHFTVKRNPLFHTSCYKIICKQCTESHQCREKDAKMLRLNFLIDAYKEFLCFFRDRPPTLDLHRLRDKLLAAPKKSAQSSSRPNTAKAGAGTTQANLNSESESEPARPMQTTDLDTPKRIVSIEHPSVPTTPVVSQVNVEHPTPPVLPERVTAVGANNKLDERRTSADAEQPRTCANCGGVVDVKAFNLCITCPMKCVCQDCILVHHWNLGHQIQKSGPAVLTAVAYSEHSNMVKKMDNWKIRIDDCYEQGTDAHTTLHTTFNDVYTTAMRANPRGTLPSAELDQLNQSIENTCNAHAALIEEIRTLSQRCASVGAALSGTANTAAGGD